MFFLRHRGLWSDVIEVFKMILGIDKVNLRKHFYIKGDGRTRKYSLSLKIERQVNSNIGLNFFYKEYCLLDVVVGCKSLSIF